MRQARATIANKRRRFSKLGAPLSVPAAGTCFAQCKGKYAYFLIIERIHFNQVATLASRTDIDFSVTANERVGRRMR
jgi:hypothetical protein